MKTMFESKNCHLLHKEAVRLVNNSLPGSVEIDSLMGYKTSYHIRWNDVKLLVKVARPSRKFSQPRAKWFYALREKDHEATDFFILLALLESRLEAIYVIPKVFAPAVYITITKLDGNMRYSYFRTDIQNIAAKIIELQGKLPKLMEVFKEAKVLRGGNYEIRKSL